MASPLNNLCTDLVERLGLASSEDVLGVEPLMGGVASDIAVVDLGDRKVVVKFALEKLRVVEDWHAPTHRNSAEYAWLEFAGLTVPASSPQLYGHDADLGGFAMELLQGDDTYLWKIALLDRRSTRGVAGKVGHALGKIHTASTTPRFNSDQFQNQDDFYDLRLEPYLVFTATKHPDLEDSYESVLKELQENSSVLIHGDVSPKNIIVRNGQPVFLDAECATMGDPSFDVAFCMNHLVLKSFHMPDRARGLLAEMENLWAGYSEHITWEDGRQLEARVCKLLPALMLARVDGKSPVEYLCEEDQDQVRSFARSNLTTPPQDITALVGRINNVLKR